MEQMKKNYTGLYSKFATLMGLFVLCVALSMITPKFFTLSNGINVLRQISINSMLAYGISFVIISGGIDLSIGSVVALTGTLCCGMIENGMPIGIALLVGLAFGALVGLVNGALISKLGMPPFIVTLSMMSVVRGGAYIYTKGMPIRSENDQFNALGNGYIGPIPIPVLIMLGIFVLSFLLLQKSRFGRYVYAIGGNMESARYSGIRIHRIQIGCYILCSVFAAISGIVLSARMYSGQPTSGQGFEMDAIAAVVLGGASFSGGEGTIGGTLIGALMIGVLNNGLNILNVPHYYQLIIKGLVILVAIFIDTMKRRSR